MLSFGNNRSYCIIHHMDRKYILLIGIILLVLAIAGGGFLWWSMKSKAPSAGPAPTPTPISSPVVTPTPAEETKSSPEQIKEAFAKKYNKSLDEVNITISKNTGTHATGGVSFAGEIGGAMWLAYNDEGNWIIVHDGHGTIPCSAIEPYDFPVDMVPECWDEATSKLIKRG